MRTLQHPVSHPWLRLKTEETPRGLQLIVPVHDERIIGDCDSFPGISMCEPYYGYGGL